MNKDEQNTAPLAAWFLGPKAEHSKEWIEIINYIFQDYVHWRRNYFPNDKVIVNRHKRREHEIWFDSLNTEIDKLVSQLKAHYPFHSPRYIAHMLSEQTLPAVVGYFAGMLYNPNNVTDEAAPITVKLEIEVGKMISEMLGYDTKSSWAHLTSGGTIANFEAMWVSRISQFTPLIVKEYCIENKYDFIIKTPNNSFKNICDIDNIELLHLKPNEALYMPRKLAQYLIKDLNKKESIINEINKHFSTSRFNIKKKGTISIYNELNIEHIIFVSEAAHYCFHKICNLLGIGEESVRLIPVDSSFRINTVKLKQALWNLQPNQIPLAVVGIVGTTEEGAIDPIHEIQNIRAEYEKKKNRSFWLHIDGAYGGYIRSIIKSPDISLNYDAKSFDEIFEEYNSLQDINETISFFSSTIKIDWKNPQLFKSILSIKESDSITIDPHKLGYIPYPAGVICFKNGLVTELITQKAQYISDEEGGMKNIDEPINITAVGPYIIEGSKPGAAAAATYLAHKTIPLNNKGHGKIIRTTLLNAQKLYIYLSQHKRYFKEIEKELFNSFNKDDDSFSFEPLYQPDTNLICFIVTPYNWSHNKLIKKDISLKLLNEINESIYSKLSISNKEEENKMPYSQEFFISRSRLEQSQYGYNSIKELLKSLNISRTEYKKDGLFILRSTLMNPWHYMASQNGEDYLFKFIMHLHKISKQVLKEKTHNKQ